MLNVINACIVAYLSCEQLCGTKMSRRENYVLRKVNNGEPCRITSKYLQEILIANLQN